MRAFPAGLLLLIAVTANAAEPPKSPLSPEESLKHLVLADPNLQIELVAAEPEVIDPVAIQFDEHGRLWVVELSDYPNGPEPGKPPMSRIKLLEDKDGDGRYETAHIFADKLLFATGVQPWDGGVIVTLAGEVAYFKDTDGDHKADVRETWFTGFAQANTQLRANHPTFGPDGWIYVANGLRGGNVIAVKKDWPSRLGLRPDPSGKVRVGTESQPTDPQPVSLTGRDFKFDPLTGRYEAISGNGQFGMTFDAWGNRFVCDNRHPCRHVIFEEDFIKRCPHVAFPAVVHDVIPADDKNQVFPLTSAWTTSNLHAGTFTAACGVTVYTGDWLPEEFRGNVFVCEPTGNLVQRAILEPDGVTFKSRRGVGFQPAAPPASTKASENKPAEQRQAGSLTHEAEFLASRDDWFRPVDLQNGPDGALYVVDMYRAVIEHPEWVPDELKKRPDTWLGNDKGRIYRIRPSSPVAPRQEQPSARSTSEKQSTSTARSADLSRSDRATLGKPIVSVANLSSSFDSKNGWHRRTAARLLMERHLNHDQQFFGLIDGKWVPSTAAGLSAALHLRPGDFHMAGYAKHRELWQQTENPWARSQLLSLARHGQWNEKEFLDTKYLALNDPHPRVRFMLSIELAQHPQEVRWFSETQWGRPTYKDLNDPWLRLGMFGNLDHPTAAMFNVSQPVPSPWMGQGGLVAMRMLGEMWATWEKNDSDSLKSPQGRLDFALSKFAEYVVYRHEMNSGTRPLAGINPEGFDVAATLLCGMGNTLNRRGTSASAATAKLSDGSRNVLNAMLAFARTTVEDKRKQADARIDDQQFQTRRLLAVEFMRLGSFEVSGVALKELASESSDQKLRLAALESLTSFPSPEVEAWLIERYRSETPAIRRAILAALFASKERQLRLLEAIEQKQIAATELDPVRVNQLTQAKDETLRERAKTVLAAAAPASRHEVLNAYRPALALTADPKRGREVFVKNCSTCHRVDNVGVNVAPDISDTRTKKPEQLLLDILDPNKAIDANYFAYAVVTKEGKAESGVISSETATSITLKQPEGKVLTLLRSDIDELRNTGLSLMPVGVEKNIDQQAMADLIFWLKNWRYLDGKVPATSLK